MFKNQVQHETGLNKPFIQNMEGKWKSVQRIRAHIKNGARFKPRCPKLEARIRKCYPRGKCADRVILLGSCDWVCKSTGGRLSNGT